MFQGHPEAAARPIPFDASTGRRFMMIAAHPLLSNRANWHVLPYSWRTLYELTKVPETILAAALVDGRVHLKMRGADAIALRHDHDAVKRMVRLVRAETLQWGPELLGAFRTALDHDLLARIQGGARARQEVAADLLDLPGPGQTERQWREARWGAGA